MILDPDRTYPNVEDRMRLAVELSREGSRRGSGGTFGVAIDRETNKLLAPGVNLVLASAYSFGHAEMVAIMAAHQLVGASTWEGRGSHLTSWSPAPSLAPCASGRFTDLA